MLVCFNVGRHNLWIYSDLENVYLLPLHTTTFGNITTLLEYMLKVNCLLFIKAVIIK